MEQAIQVFAGKLVKNSFTRCWVPFRDFRPFSCPFIYTLSIIVRRCRKSPRFFLYLHIGQTWSFSLPGTWSKVSSTKKNFVAKYFRQGSWFGEKFVPQTAYSSSEVNKYTAELSFGSSRNTLYRERLIKKEDFKRRDRRRSFSISLVFIRQFWNRVRKRDHVRHKEMIIINRCAEIYSRRNSTGRAIDQPEFRRRWFSQSSYK